MSDSPELTYLRQLQNEEKQRATAYIDGMSGVLDEHAKEAVTELFADISSRVRVVEEYLVKQSGKGEDFSKQESTLFTMPEEGFYKFAIEHFEHESLGWLEHNAMGIPFRKVDTVKAVTRYLSINRKKTLTLTVDILGCSDKSALDSTVIEIDGVSMRKRIANIDGQLRYVVRIPPSKNEASTHLMLKFPEENKAFKVAIGDIFCVPSLGFWGYFSKFVRN